MDRVTGKPMLVLINVATGQVWQPSITGAVLPNLVGGAEWVESAQKLAMYEGGVTSDQEREGRDSLIGFGLLPRRPPLIQLFSLRRLGR